MLAWPTELEDHVYRDGFEYPLPDGRMRGQMDRGPAKTRGSPSGQPNTIPCSVPVDVSGLARFDRFFGEETGGGNLPFLIRDQKYDGLPLFTADGLPLLTSDGAPLLLTAFWIVRFGEMAPREQALGGPYWRIFFELERLDG